MPLTPEERALITEIEDRLIERFVDRSEAIQDGQEERAKEIEIEIDQLLEEKALIRGTAVGSA
jgi:hypothetical protein